MIAQEITQKEVNNLYNQMKKEEGKLQRAQKTCDDVAEKLEQAKADVNLAQIESDNAQKAFEEADRKGPPVFRRPHFSCQNIRLCVFYQLIDDDFSLFDFTAFQ